MAGCLFCKIGAKEIASESVYEDAHVIAFLDIHPKAPGHTMVVPKVHAETILDLPEKEVEPLFRAVRKVIGKVNSGLKPEGYTIGINHGRKAGQMVDHLHVHVIPRWSGDGGGSIHSIVQNTPGESLAEIAKKIREA
ncbi:MAG: HIT family protein [Patescibacteria group bacterium]